MEEALRLIPPNTPITNLSPGAIARTLLEVMNKELATYYERLTVADSMGFLSTATGSRVNLIGRMLDSTGGRMNRMRTTSTESASR